MLPMTHVVNTKVIESLGDLNLLFGIKKGVGELLAFTQCTLNDLKPGDIAQEVGHSDIVTVWIARSGRVRVLTGLDTSEAGVVYKSESVPIASKAPLLAFTVTIDLAVGTVGLPIGLGLGAGTHCE